MNEPIAPILPHEPIELPDDSTVLQGLAILKQLLKSNPMAVVMTESTLNPPGPQITFANSTFLCQTGYAIDEILGKTPRVFQGEQTSRAILDRLRSELVLGLSFQGETVNYRKDGTPYFVRWSIVPVMYRGRVVRFLSYQVALSGAPTPFYPMASMRFSTNDPFEAIFDTTEIGIAVIDRNLKFVRVNDALCRLLDYEPSALIGRFCLEFYADTQSIPETMEALDGVFEGIIELNTDYRLRRRDGATITLRGDCRVLRALDGQQYIVWTIVDVTAKLALEHRLQLNELRLDLVIHGCGLGFWDYDCKTREVYYSPGWKRMLGYADHELPDDPAEWESRIQPDDYARVQATLSDFLFGRTNEYRIEYRMRHRDGSDRVIDARGAAIRDDRGRAVRFAGTHTDVTDRQRLEQQLRQTQKLDAIGQLAGGIAHDFNNILTVILGNLDLIKLPAGDRNRPLVDAATTAALRAAELTSKVLGYARKSTFTFTDAVPAELIHDVVTMLKPTFDPRIAIGVDLPDNLPIVRGDANSLLQSILNLVLNARDAMPNGGELRLRAETVVISPGQPSGGSTPAKPGEYVRFRIADIGCGMDTATIARLFEPFFTTKPVGKGSGMGLAVAYGTIHQHGGWITVESEVKKGSRFDVYLPAVRRDRRVLIVDDEPSVRSFLSYGLRLAGWSVSEAECAADARDRLAQFPASVILLDLNMPGESGESAFRSLRGQAPNAIILLISGGSFEERWHEEADGLVRKPCDIDDVIRTFNTLLDKQKSPAGDLVGVAHSPK